MLIEFDDRESDSPYIERVWRSRSRDGGAFLSMADSNIELVVSRLPGSTAVTLRGPVSRASRVDCPPQGRWLAIRFRIGAFFPSFPTATLADHQSIELPVVDRDRLLLAGAAWEIPSFDNAEQFVAGLAEAKVIALSGHARAMLEGDPTRVSQRSLQRHFREVTGITLSRHRQIERARNAAGLLLEGRSLLDATFDAGYFDQAHFTRSLRDLVGATPARLARDRPQLSFSYKTSVR